MLFLKFNMKYVALILNDAFILSASGFSFLGGAGAGTSGIGAGASSGAGPARKSSGGDSFGFVLDAMKASK